jgi:hypothetical protein
MYEVVRFFYKKGCHVYLLLLIEKDEEFGLCIRRMTAEKLPREGRRGQLCTSWGALHIYSIHYRHILLWAVKRILSNFSKREREKFLFPAHNFCIERAR